MSLVEQAAKRLEELRRAGAEIGNSREAAPAPGGEDGAPPERVPTPEAAVRGIVAASELQNRQALRADPPEVSAARGGTPASARTQRGAFQLEINIDRLKSRGMVTPDAPRSQIADEFRVIKRPIVRNALGRSGVKVKNGNLVMVTSALPGEGKTFTSVNLA
ncbi:MAG: chromosome partitioning ATPase, partial [Casimicrobiaceae bacterium]